MNRYGTIKAFMAITLLAGLAACEYKDLDEGLSRVDFTLDFSHERVESTPASYRVAFFPADEETRGNITRGYRLFDVKNEPTVLSLPAGNYKVTAWNNDTEHVLTEGYGSKESLYATTMRYRSMGGYEMPKVVDSLFHGMPVLDYPDYMVHANEENFTLYEEPGQRLTLHPDSMVITVDIKARGIRGLEWVREARGSISNVAGTRFIGEDNLTKDTVVVMFECQCDFNDSTVTAHFWLFGMEPTGAKLDHRIIFVFYFWLDNGKVYLPVDVTDIIREEQEKGKKDHIEIVLPELDINLKDYVTSKSAYSVDVDDWDDVYIDIGF